MDAADILKGRHTSMRPHIVTTQ